MNKFYSIGEVCGAIAGLQALVFTDMANVSNYGPGFLPPSPGNPPNFIDANKVYSIAFERYSAELTRDSRNDQGGDYEDINLTAFVPRSRSDVDILLRRMRNRLMLLIGIDYYGNQHLIYNAQRSFRHSTGSKPGTRHGYQLTFYGSGHYILPAIAGNGEILTAPPDPGGGGGSSSSECCISINPVQIAYTPSLTGNANNRNELVTTTNGAVYFIDSTGRGILLNRPGPQYYSVLLAPGYGLTYIDVPAWFWIPNPADYPAPSYDTEHEISRRLHVIMSSRKLGYEHPEGWTMDYNARRIYFFGFIDEAFIELYSFQSIITANQ